MANSYTPGPWKILFGGMDQDDFAVIGSPHVDRAICSLEPRDYTQANAKLIAAAPSLLEAAIAVLDQVELEGRDTGTGDAFSDLRDVIEAAIAIKKESDEIS